MQRPDYTNGSIVNLMASVEKACGGRPYHEMLKEISSEKLRDADNLVLFVIDGLGYEIVKKFGKGGLFNQKLLGSMNTVFPSTTACAIPVFYTGLYPYEHGNTGWFMWLKELGSIVSTLPFRPVMGGQELGKQGIDLAIVFDRKPFSDKIKRKSFLITRDKYSDTDFTKSYKGKSKVIGYRSFPQLIRELKKTIKIPGKKFIMCYWDKFDEIGHDKGPFSKNAEEHFHYIDKRVSKIETLLRKNNTTMIITADHGGIKSVNKNKRILFRGHQKLMEMLRASFIFEMRFAYAYVEKGKESSFEDYMRKNLSYCCDFLKSEVALKKGLFGKVEKEKVHPRFMERIGDYVIIMKDDYVIADFPPVDRKKMQGFHGGLTDREMKVPLIVLGKSIR